MAWGQAPGAGSGEEEDAAGYPCGQINTDHQLLTVPSAVLLDTNHVTHTLPSPACPAPHALTPGAGAPRPDVPVRSLPHPHSYFGFITKHPLLSRFACHVFVSQESMRPVAQSVG